MRETLSVAPSLEEQLFASLMAAQTSVADPSSVMFVFPVDANCGIDRFSGATAHVQYLPNLAVVSGRKTGTAVGGEESLP